MNILTRNLFNAVLCTTLLAGPANADEDPQFDFRAAAGFQYDSNVSVSELDTNTGEADNALLLELAADAGLPISDALSLKLGYGYSQTSYQDYGEFDMALHRLQGDLAYRVAGFDAGMSLRRFDARLDNERFLDIRQVSPSIARLLGKSVYLRGSYTAAEKRYADHGERDASGDAVDLDVYLLLDGMNRYVSVGYRLDSEDATADELDFDGNRLRLAYGQSFDKLELKARLQLAERDYANLDEEIGEARRDTVLRAGLSAVFALNERFGIEGDAVFVDTASNLPGADFDEVTYSLSLAAGF